ncbi:MAG TPA: hypothetical protein VKR55_20920 [Bradyrhizobium sp.]|uniref:hypothetical protein n=1 Tax=Bradyrhizobium sp. TaxID=376 RepID=UPI002C9BA1A4|nr:hypothetical protein [Bradyrhizobium sp.]HLZ04594.1 hypothetical protein [Bradyrhizobium sp.]
MKPLVLTSMSGFHFTVSDYAEVTIPFSFRFVWGALPSLDELAAYLGLRSQEQKRGTHWSDFVDWGRGRIVPGASKHCGLIEFCRHYETIELWFDPDPNDQLQLIWLLDHLRSDPQVATKLTLSLVDCDLNNISREWLAEFEKPAVDVAEAEFETARMAWHAYREPTPEACFDLLREDLGALPLLKPALRDLLEELPSTSTGLGATEMRMLELIKRGYQLTNALFHLTELRLTRIFSEWEHGYLLDGLAHGPTPAVAGLDEELRTISRENLGARHPLYLRSRLSLTEFGEAVGAHEVDFSRHNPIDRWWGGTHLTSDRLWHFDPVLTRL